MSALGRLTDLSRGPAGQPRDVDFRTATGPLAELAQLLSRRNGFFVFNAGIQVFHAGAHGVGPELQTWNHQDTWKHTYNGLADDLFCFGQDLFGVQFAVENHERIVTFDPETANRSMVGNTLEDWAQWLLDDPDVRGCRAFATAWQYENGALEYDERLIPWRFFALGGTYDFPNLTAKEGAEGMRIRGPIAQRIHDSRDGQAVTLTSSAYGS